MDWARRRQVIAIALMTGALIVVLLGVAFAVFYRVPTCMDRTQNQGETGIDCGGPCSTVCTAEALPPVVRFARAIVSQPGRIDAIAYVDNPNGAAAAARVRGTIELYDSSRALLASQEVTFDLSPGRFVPVYIPGISFTDRQVTQAFLTIDPDSIHWFQTSIAIELPKVTDISIQQGAQPRITAMLNNVTAEPIEGITLIATVFDAEENAIAASRTVVPSLPPQGRAPMVFTWNVPFPDVAARVEIVPLISVSPAGI